jgi:hypothetical protein
VRKFFWPLAGPAVASSSSKTASTVRRSVESSNSIPSSAHVADTSKTNSSEWFYSQLGEVYGPISTPDLLAAGHLCFLGPDDLVRPADAGTWVPARLLRGLFKRCE